MKIFETLAFSQTKCRKEVLDFKDLLAKSSTLEEGKHIMPFFRARKHLSALIGICNKRIGRYDLVAWEYDLFGDFSCDMAIGDSDSKAYCFVEFEDAGPRSLFVKQGNKATREWSPRFDHAYSQVIDWFYKMEDCRKSDEYQVRFGKRSVDYAGVVLAGRDQHMSEGERLRFEWRRQHVIVHSRNVLCLTYDELLQNMLFTLDRWSQAGQPGG